MGPNRARMELLDIFPSTPVLAPLSPGLLSDTLGAELGTETGLGLVETKSPNSEFRPSKSFVEELLGTLATVEGLEGDPRESPRRSVSRVLALFTTPRFATAGFTATGLGATAWGLGLADDLAGA